MKQSEAQGENSAAGECQIRGIAASSGVVIGPAVIMIHDLVEVDSTPISPHQVDGQNLAFETSLKCTETQLLTIKQELADIFGRNHAYLIDAQLTMLQDHVFLNGVTTKIRRQLMSAESAVESTLAEIRQAFNALQDDYLKQRIKDIEDLVARLLTNLRGGSNDLVFEQLRQHILVSKDLKPSQMVRLQDSGLLGIVIEQGSLTSHAAIVTRDFGIPAIVGVGKVVELVRPRDTLILDGGAGVLIIRPDPATLHHYRHAVAEYQTEVAKLQRLGTVPAITKDGEQISLQANIDFPGEIETVTRNKGVSVGLFRTEFLYMGRDRLPTEDEQFEIYHSLAKQLEPSYLTIRTFDLGGDKLSDLVPLADEKNPALGLRAIRLGLKERSILQTQLRAILRAGSAGNIRILLPLVSNAGEVIEVRSMMAAILAQLQLEGVKLDKPIPLGVMIETPAAALTAYEFAQLVDFISIGTNDLIQFTLAIDRGNDAVAYLYEPLHSAVLHLLQNTIIAARRHGTPISMCGEMAGDPIYTPLLLGLGLTSFSMNIGIIPHVKKVIRSLSLTEAKDWTEIVFSLRDLKQRRAFLEEKHRELTQET